jgi:ATP-dependent DNA helicase RecQ
VEVGRERVLSTDAASVEETIRELARSRFGFSELRPGQLRGVAAAVEGRDVLAVLPTGGGKSAIYELAGLLREGPTVVVSPLIALQDDQLAHLRDVGLEAIVLNSHQSPKEHTAALEASCRPETFVFLSPEQLGNAETVDALRRARPGLFAVDEAHLISQWGHDFRPDYMRLSAQADQLRAPVRMALTATAAPPVQNEIVRRLQLQDPEIVVGDFDRPQLELAARGVRSVDEKHRELEAAAAELEGPGIVYAATHADAEAAHDVLAAAGDAGRDRQPAHARLIYRSEDFGAAVHFATGGVSTKTVARVAAELATGAELEGTRGETAALVRLVDVDAAVWEAGGAVRWTEALTVADAVAASDAETTRENEIERTRLEMMRRYAEHTGCRRSFLLSYFGQDYPGPCGNCDNDGRAVTAEPTLKPFAVGERVISERWGDGTVQRYDGDQLTVLFDEHGYRDLLLSLVIERKLLRRA